jgi:transposase-like protein
MEKVLNNPDLLKQIIAFLPLTEEEQRARKRVVSELKHMYCEWSEHKKYCYVCKPYHPLVINQRRKYMCRDCNRLFRFYMATRI